MDKIFVTLSSVVAMGIIYWFFFSKNEQSVAVSDTWNIRVDGGYKPSTIKVNRNKPATLIFTRTNPNSCLEEVVFPDYKIKEYLPLHKPVTIILPPRKSGSSDYHCSMNMFFGKIEII